MIKEVWIIDGSGLCLIHRNYGGIGHDPNLISGFFTAISNFAHEVGNSEIEKIQLADFSFSCLMKKGLLFVISSDKEDEPGDIVHKISDLFIKTFENRMFLFGELLREYSLDEVSRFNLHVDKITQRTPKPTKPTYELPDQFIPERIGPLVKTLKRGSPEYKELFQEFGIDGIDVLISIDGRRSLTDIQNLLSMGMQKIKAITTYALRKKMLRTIIFPQDPSPPDTNAFEKHNSPPVKESANLCQDNPFPDPELNSADLNIPLAPEFPSIQSSPSDHIQDPDFLLGDLIPEDKVIQFCFVCGNPLNIPIQTDLLPTITREYIQCGSCRAIYHEKCLRRKGIFNKNKYTCPQCNHKGKSKGVLF